MLKLPLIESISAGKREETPFSETFLTFSLMGMAIAITAYFLFANESILPDPSIVGDSGVELSQAPFAEKIYDVLTSALMICIYTGLIFGAALKRLGLGREADAISKTRRW